MAISNSHVTQNKRYDELEWLRGLAASGVVVYHFIRAFISTYRENPQSLYFGLSIEPPIVLAIVNGPFMVSVFFVLSSFALTVKLLDARAPLRVGIAIGKRFPRLFPITFIGAALPALLYALGYMYNEEAAVLTRSDWSRFSGGVKVGEHWPTPSIFGGFKDSIYLFVRGISQYNSALWTMKYELIGSIIALLFALLISGNSRTLIDFLITFIISVLVANIHILCSLCVVTVCITKYVRHSNLYLSPKTAFVIIIFGLIIGSTYKAVPAGIPYARDMDWILHGLGAILIFLGVHRWRRIHVRIWPFGLFLGRISFSMYAIHIPIIGSLGSGIIVYMGYSTSSVLASAILSGAAILVLSNYISKIDAWWIVKLNVISKNIITRCNRGDHALKRSSTGSIL